jgi:metal-responsive CopG/Arc/MetJ family transcriptional regulator
VIILKQKEKNKKQFVSISIPRGLVNEIETLMKKNPEKLKTHTKSGFIREAVEEHIKRFYKNENSNEIDFFEIQKIIFQTLDDMAKKGKIKLSK